MFGSAGAAVAVLAIAIYLQTIASATVTNSIQIPFSVTVQPDNIEISKGKAANMAVLVETQKNAQFDLNLEVSAYAEDSSNLALLDAATNHIPDIKVDRSSIHVSDLLPAVTDLGPDRVQKNSGASITISVPADAPAGTYTYMIDAKQLPSRNGPTLGAGKIFTVIVK